MTEGPDLPDLMTLNDVLARLRGKIGRTTLLQHLATVPVYAGKPTHGRLGRRFRFTQAQYANLVESLAVPPPPRAPNGAMPAFPSEDRAYERVQALTAKLLRKPATKRAAGSPSRGSRST